MCVRERDQHTWQSNRYSTDRFGLDGEADNYYSRNKLEVRWVGTVNYLKGTSPTSIQSPSLSS